MRLIHGDCLKKLSEVADGSVDMVFADLPYGVTRNSFDLGSTGRRVDAKPIHKKTYLLDIAKLWVHLLRVGKRNCMFAFTGVQPFTSLVVFSNPSIFKYELIWDKVRASRWFHAKNMPLAQHENVLCFYRARPTYHPQMVKRSTPKRLGRIRVRSGNYSGNKNQELLDPNKVYTHRYPTSILSHHKNNRACHPNQKPVALLEWLIKTYTNPGDTVLDPCCGSGTTLVAAANTGRHAIGCERDEHFYRVAQKRLADAMAAPPPTSVG